MFKFDDKSVVLIAKVSSIEELIKDINQYKILGYWSSFIDHDLIIKGDLDSKMKDYLSEYLEMYRIKLTFLS